MSARLLSAVGGSCVVTRVTLSTDHFVTVVLLRQNTERRLDDTSSETKHQMEGRLLLDVIVREGSTVFELLSGKD